MTGYRLLLLILIVLTFSASIKAQKAEHGLLDLREANLYQEEILLDGEWEFYWNQLIPPRGQFPTPKDFYSFPDLWNRGETTQGVRLSNFGHGTYRLKVLLPDSMPDIGFYIKHVYCSYRLFVNDRQVAVSGEVGTDKKTSMPKWVPMVINLSGQQTDTLDLVLQISNYRHRKGGARESIVLGNVENLKVETNSILAFDLLLAGTLIMSGFFFYGLFLFGQREKASIYFALFCLTFSYRIIGADDYSLQVLYPDMSWWLSVKLEYLSLFVPPVFFALYTDTLFPFRYRVNPFRIIVMISIAFAAISIFFPPYIFTALVEPYLVVLLLGITLAGYVYTRAYRLNLSGAKYAVISSAVVLVVFIYKIFNYFGALQEVELISFIGYFAFFFFQSLILFFLFTNSLKKAKEEAEHASKAKSKFLSMMSHEIRTPMNAVIGLTNYLLDDEPKKNQLETLNTLKFSAQNLLVIINDILDFSKIEAEKMEFDPGEVKVKELMRSIYQVFKPITEAKKLDLVFELDPRIPPYIICDQTRTSQVLTNLISNAIKFTKEGEIRVSLSLVDRAVGTVTILFKVVDSGIGIPREKQQHVFESFTQASSSTTRQFGGTGLGLSITNKLLELQGSRLHLESEEGMGSTFYFEQQFEVGDGSQAQSLLMPEDIEQAEVNHEILLVEDNEINTMVATKFLLKWGAKVTLARNGKEALDLLDKMSFRLILMDLQMPVMDGFEAVREIRKRGIKTPVIALTASALMERQKKIYEAGMDDYVIKPFDPKELLKKILHFTH